MTSLRDRLARARPPPPPPPPKSSCRPPPLPSCMILNSPEFDRSLANPRIGDDFANSGRKPRCIMRKHEASRKHVYIYARPTDRFINFLTFKLCGGLLPSRFVTPINITTIELSERNGMTSVMSCYEKRRETWGGKYESLLYLSCVSRKHRP